MATPIIPWIGGKRRLADQLIPRFPVHTCYVEVFAGGAALYFLRPPAEVEVINDINGELVNLYRVVKHHLEEFVRQFKWALSSRDVFKWLQDTPPETMTDVQRAARFYYLQHQAFGGKVQGQTWGTATTAPPINLLRIEEQLSAAHLRLANTYVERLHWRECIERYDRAHTFFYMDPPYWQTEGYGVPFPWAEYEAMAEVMRNIKGKALVSINDHPDIRAAFAGFHTETLDISYTVGGGAKPPRAANSSSGAGTRPRILPACSRPCPSAAVWHARRACTAGAAERYWGHQPGGNMLDTGKELTKINNEDLKKDLAGFLQCVPTANLAAAARGELDIVALVKAELQSRGLDAQGKWIGFKAANALWGQRLG